MCGKIREIEEEAGEELFPAHEDDPRFDFGEALQAIEQDALTHGFDLGFPDEIQCPPRPKEFLLYRRVKSAGNRLDRLCKALLLENSTIGEEETFKDLQWYRYTMQAKAYRQLCNRWYLSQGNRHSDLDYAYTQFVLTELLAILETSLHDLRGKTQRHQHDIRTAIRHLSVLESELLNI